MNRSLRLSLVALGLVSLHAFGAAKQTSTKFKDQPPHFYAVIAQAAYIHDYKEAQAYLDKKLGAGVARARQCV